MMFFQALPNQDVEGEELDTVEIRVRLGREGFDRLRTTSVPVTSVFLTEQPDGSYALGVTTREHPRALGMKARKVEHDDRAERFA